MIWIILATIFVVFIVGFRILTSGTRQAIRHLNERLGVSLVIIESMVDQMGKQSGDAFLHYLRRPNEAHIQNAAQVLLIWQVTIMDGSQQNLQYWYDVLKKARLAMPITDTQLRLALGFLHEMEIEMQELRAFQIRYNSLFQSEDGVAWLH